MKNFWKRTKNTRATSLAIMKAALLVAVALVSGVVVCAIAYDLIFFWGITVLYIAVQVAIAVSIAALTWNAIGELAALFARHAGPRINWETIGKVVYPFGNDPLDA